LDRRKIKSVGSVPHPAQQDYPRKFRSQTSDKMTEKRRRKKIKEEKESEERSCKCAKR
jgi:hypothetical protein